MGTLSAVSCSSAPLLFFADVGIDADAWHLTVVSEAGGQLLKNGRTVNFLGHGDGKSDCVEVGIQKVALRFCRRGGIIDDANCHTDRLGSVGTLISRTSTNAFQNETKGSSSGTTESGSECGLCSAFGFSEVIDCLAE